MYSIIVEWPDRLYSQWSFEMSDSIDEFLVAVDGPVHKDRPKRNWIVSFKTGIGDSEWINCCTKCGGEGASTAEAGV